jgi:hypothetical protein
MDGPKTTFSVDFPMLGFYRGLKKHRQPNPRM